MFFKTMKCTSKRKPMLFFQIVFAFVMFIIMINRGYINNIFNSIFRLNILNPEALILDIGNLIRLALFDKIIFMGLSCLLLQISVFIAITTSLITLIVYLIKECVVCRVQNNTEKTANISNNNIYLITNKFIC